MKTELKYLIAALLLGVPFVFWMLDSFIIVAFFSADNIMPEVPQWIALLAALSGIPFGMFIVEVHKSRGATT